MDIREAASAMGRVTSEKKTQTSRENGKKGGRPKLKLSVTVEELETILDRAMDSEHFALTDNPDPPSRDARIKKLAQRIFAGE